MVSINHLFHAIALSQGIEPGTPLFNSGGNDAWAQQTGEHSSYPWRVDDQWSPAWVQAVVSNWCWRSHYEVDAPLRQLTPNAAGRRKGWAPELPTDLADGRSAFLTSNGIVIVANPDLHHVHLTQVALICDKPLDVPTPWGTVSSRIIGREIIRYTIKAIAGQVRQNLHDNYWMGDRPVACVFKAAILAAKRQLIDEEDFATLLAYLELVLARYEGPQAKQVTDKYYLSASPIPTLNPWYYWQLYNGLYWVLPVFYDLVPLLQGTLRARVDAIVARFSQYMLDLELLAPGKGTLVAGVSFPDSMLGAPQTNWKGLTAANLHWSDNDPAWGIRAQWCAAKKLGSSVLAMSAEQLVAKHAAKKGWCVDADGAYVAATPVGPK